MDEPVAEAPPRPARRGFWREFPFLLVVAIGLAVLIRVFVVQVFYIPSGSMEETLLVGDRVLVNKAVYHVRDVQRGDVVVFDGLDSFTPEVDVEEPANPVQGALQWVAGVLGMAPGGERDFIKRVIGVGGDRVTCCDAEGRITVNGVALDESSYLFPGDSPSDEPFDIVVPPGRLWVMGDHRSESSDSRAHLGDPGGGTVSVEKVIGRAAVVAWPFGEWRVLSIPATFAQPALDRGGGR